VKHITPDRLLRLQDRFDEVHFLSALDEWEAAIAGYRKRLQAIEGALPSAVRRLISKVPLHDARIIDISHEQESRCTINLQPQSVSESEVVLGYSLVEPVRVLEDALAEAVRSHPLAWLNDEVDIVPTPRKRSRNTANTAPTFRHSILLSNGWELCLHFRRLTMTRPVSLLREGRDLPTNRSAVSRSA
jgi:hypothetical protein